MNAPLPLVTLRRGTACAEAALAGGELRRWCDQRRELLWDANARWWPHSSQVLFPTVGRLHKGRALIDGRTREMGAHGFASMQPFTVRSVAPDHATLGLASNATTLAIYPFDFDLSLRYRLHEFGLEVSFRVVNTGSRPLPFALGFHPGLRWPFAVASAAGHAMVFDQPESAQLPVVTDEGLISPARQTVPLQGKRLPLDGALFNRDALCFIDANSRELRFESPDGSAITVSAIDFPHWALWTRPGAPFLCVEAWTGYADPQGYEGEFAAKPSMRHLAPGAATRHVVNMRFEAAPA